MLLFLPLRFFFFVLLSSFFPVAALDVLVNGASVALYASRPEGVADAVRSFLASHQLETGGGCEHLSEAHRRDSCFFAVLETALTEELMAEDVADTPPSSLFLRRWLEQPKAYTRTLEMSWRRVLRANPTRATVILGELSDQYPLARLMLEDQSAAAAAAEQPAEAASGRLPKKLLCTVTVATSVKPQLLRLNASVTASGMFLKILGLGQTWGGHGTKIILLDEFLASTEAAVCTEVLFLDAYDTLVLQATESDIRRRFRALLRGSEGIVFNGETECTPDPSIRSEWPTSGPLPYLNSGVFMGSAAFVRRLVKESLEDIRDNFFLTSKSSMAQADDQRFYSRWFLRNQGTAAVDTNGFLFQTLHDHAAHSFVVSRELGQGTVFSRSTGSAPLVLHGNGNGCGTLLSIVEQLGAVSDWPPAGFNSPAVSASEKEACTWPFNSF